MHSSAASTPFRTLAAACLIAAPVVAAATLPSPLAAQLVEATGRVIPIHVNGDAEDRFSLVILGDGYTAAEMPKFRADVEKHLNIMWSLEPFRSYRSYFNVYAVETASPQSGITCDPSHREQRNTTIKLYFDGGCTNPNARGILVNQTEARRFAQLATASPDQILVIANTSTYGGIGGSTATTSADNALSPYITPHELGHSLGRLQDEYTYSARGVMGPAYTGAEPTSVQHTLLTEAEMRSQQKKWWRWLGEPSESGGIIGRFEGGQSRVSGVWRPSRHSMMISLGYYFDQVSLERMTQRIAERVDLITAATDTGSPVNVRGLIVLETQRPVYHELDIEWAVDGKVIEAAANAPFIDLAKLQLTNADHTITVKVTDPTPFVRDPLIRDTSLTATRTWRIAHEFANMPSVQAYPRFTGGTQTERPVGGTDVIAVATSYPHSEVPTVSWMLNGSAVSTSSHGRSLSLAKLALPQGTHRVTAVAAASVPGAPLKDSLTWTIDNTPPVVRFELGGAITRTADRDGPQHFVATDSFTMKLIPTDDMPGYVVAEFRVNGDGWHHYYGWPDAPPGEPFHFTARGTTIKELVYGSLSAEGLSPQPWEARAPGWRTHTIEYRARDAAGNIGPIERFLVTLQPSRP